MLLGAISFIKNTICLHLQTKALSLENLSCGDENITYDIASGFTSSTKYSSKRSLPNQFQDFIFFHSKVFSRNQLVSLKSKL